MSKRARVIHQQFQHCSINNSVRERERGLRVAMV
jgi:hypothetical protein